MFMYFSSNELMKCHFKKPGYFGPYYTTLA